jgi:hypothetical protein
VGRFLTEDTLRGVSLKMHNEQELIDPLSLNLYTYCYNNPVLYFDQSGNNPLYVLWIYLSTLATAPDTPMDMQFIAIDIAYRDWTGLVMDAAGLLFPGIPGTGAVSREARLLAKQFTKYERVLSVISKTGRTVKAGENIIGVLLSAKKVGHLRDVLMQLPADKQLKSLISELWRNPNPAKPFIGNGGTADFIRYELKYGVPEGLTSHLTKGRARVNELKKMMASGRLNADDYMLAHAIYVDLVKALNGH